MYKAHVAVPTPLKQRLAGKKALHIHEYKRAEKLDIKEDLSGSPHFFHPVFATHPNTGRKTLFVDRLMTQRIDGISLQESDDILEQLYERIVGLFARMKASEAPGRVVHSAKSWLCHHAADRSAPFLRWGSTVLAREQKISPVRAAALILNYLRAIWNSRFAEAGFAFDDQDITVTVPASFDATAQRLTIIAAEEAAGFSPWRVLSIPATF